MARWDEWAHKRPRDYQALINPGSVDTIRNCAPWHLRVALASSSPWFSIEEVLKRAGCRMPFEYVVSFREQFKESKPGARHLPACAGPAGSARESLLLR